MVEKLTVIGPLDHDTIHRRFIGDLQDWTALLLAFVVFSLSASSVYFLNDWVDVNKDRKHPSKWKRPLASGGIPLAMAPIGSLTLAMISIGCSWLFLGVPFTLILITYLALNILYSFTFKTKAILDVIVLTMMYVIRVYADGIAADVNVSNWLLSVCLFFFLSLAMAKRFSEMLTASKLGKPSDHRIRGYAISDIDVMKTFGIASAITAIAVVTIYIQEMDLPGSTGSPRLLWLLCPLILYWLARFWIITFRGELDEDPIIFALKDKVSYAICICLIAVLFASELPIFSWLV